MPHTTRGKGKPRKAPAKPPQNPVKTRTAVALGERNPETLPTGSQSHESHADNERGTRKWSALRKAAMAPGGLIGYKSTGYGH